MPSRAHRPDAVLFDAAGTLIALREPVGATYARLAREAGAGFPASRLEEAFARIFRAAPPNAHPGLPPDERPEAERQWWRARVRETFRAADQMVVIGDFEALFQTLFSHYGTPEAWELRPGARDALLALRRAGARLAVVSNFDHRLHGLLDALGIAGHFDLVLTPTDTGTAKPDPAFFAAALSRLSLAPERSVYVGDHPDDDILGARRAGIPGLDVTRLESLTALLPELGFADEAGAAPGPREHG